MSTVKVISINPWITSVSEALVETTDINSLYKIMGWVGHEVQDVMVGGTFPNGDNLLIQRTVEGNIPGFQLGNYRCHGSGVIMGNNNSEWDTPLFMLTQIQDVVRFF